jgi:hypothetical protein
VDHRLRRVLLDDVYGLFADGEPPRIVELPAAPDRQLGALTRLVETTHR